MISLIFYGVLAATAIGGFWLFVHQHDAGIRNDQIAKDTVVLERVKKERDASREAEQQREAETAACVATAAAQSTAIGDLQKRGQKAIEDSRAALAAEKTKAAANAGEMNRLRSIASASPAKDQSCEQREAKTRAILETAVKTKGK